MTTRISATPDADAGSRPLPAPASEDPPSPFERLFGVVVAAVFLTLLSMVFIARLPMRDPDVWWHLVMGHAYLDGASVRHPGPMSPLGTEDWHSRDWLSQVVMALFDQGFGLPGVAWLHGLALAVLFVSIFRVCRREVPFGPTVVATGMTFFAMLGSLSARPQVASFILLVVTVGALVRTAGDLRPRWWLPLLTAVWACTHGMWFLAIGLQAVVLVGLLLDRRLDRKALKPHLLLMALSAAAVGLTPNGFHLLTHPLGASMGIAHYIQEYQPSSISTPPYAAALIMFVVICATWARTSRVTRVEVLLVLVGLFFILYMGRTIALGAGVMAPFFARSVAVLWPEARAFLPRRIEGAVVYGGSIIALVVLAFMVPSSAKAPDDYFPSEYDARLQALPADAVLINELGDGGYLAWKYPDLRIVGDGLTDQYDVTWLDSWYSALLGRPDWNSFVEHSGADYALLHDTTPLRLGLESEDWTVVQTGQGRLMLKAPVN